MVSIKQLKYALVVEKTLHFKRAAELSNISQSALSTALRELEKQLGLQIFERDNRKVLVTPLGTQVLEMARNIMLQVEDLQHLADSQSAPLSFPITVGVIPTICPFLLPRIMPILNKRYPQSQLNIVEDQSKELIDMVSQGEMDMAILALPYPCDGLLTMEFWQEDFYWVALKGAANTQLDEIASNQLDHCELMLLKEGHCLKEHILEACTLPDLALNKALGATSLNTLIQMVLGKLGTTLIPQMALDQLISQHSELVAVHLNEAGPHRRIACAIRPNYTRMSTIEALIEICQEALSTGT